MIILSFPGRLDVWFLLAFGFAGLLCLFSLRLAWRFSKTHVSRTFSILLIVVASLFSLLLAPNYFRARKRTAASRVLEDLRMIDAALDQYAIDHRVSSPASAP